MAYEFKLPDIGEGVTEGEIVKWLVKDGDSVREDQPIVEIMTDKATVEIAAPKSGKIEQLMAKEGAVVPVGSVLVKIAVGEESATKSARVEAPTKGPTDDTPLFSASPAPSKSPAPAPTSVQVAPQMSANTGGQRVLASPATRKLAREMGVDLSAIPGSGPSGRIVKNDLQSMGTGAMRAGAPSAARGFEQSTPSPTASKTTEFGRRKPPQPTTGEERVPLRGIRRKIAEHMAVSKRTAAHFTHVDEVDMTELVDLRHAYLENAGTRSVKLTYLPFIIRSVCAGLREFPALNASLDEAKGEIVVKHFYNIGVAVATSTDDLVVPVIKNADKKTILQLAQELQAISEKARTGKLSPEDLSGGTFTITSMGQLGGVLATPIINYPEVAIMGFHKIVDRPVVREGQIVARKMANVSLSLDHRVVDGAVAASFLNRFIRYLEQPGLLMLDA